MLKLKIEYLHQQITSTTKFTTMKKVILALSLIAVLSSSFTSCSADDSALDQTTTADGLGTGTGDNGGGAGALPKPKPSV